MEVSAQLTDGDNYARARGMLQGIEQPNKPINQSSFGTGPRITTDVTLLKGYIPSVSWVGVPWELESVFLMEDSRFAKL